MFVRGGGNTCPFAQEKVPAKRRATAQKQEDPESPDPPDPWLEFCKIPWLVWT